MASFIHLRGEMLDPKMKKTSTEHQRKCKTGVVDQNCSARKCRIVQCI